LNFFGHIQYSSRKAGRKMVRKMAELKTIVRIYGEADDTFGVFDEGE
jgi:hypothetical protein